MNLDIPYDRLGVNDKVDYIPLKLAISDFNVDAADIGNNTDDLSTKSILGHNDLTSYRSNYQKRNNSTWIGNILLISLLAVFCVMVLLYALYYFVILRERRKSIVRQPYYV
ncbi:hypothetical protein [Helicoverpa armigera nucleopolyhedrovirus]|nr:hypothetical protein [Helicoverpa armigera nucleopolyhedrovirus]